MAAPVIGIVTAIAGVALIAANKKAQDFLWDSFTARPTAKDSLDEIPKSIPLPEDQKEDEIKINNNTFNTNQYNVSSNRTYIINVGSQGKSIELPSLRLPLEADQGKGTQTSRGKSIDIKKSVYEHKYGKLLHKPVTDKRLTVYECTAKDARKEFNQYQENNIKKVLSFLFNRTEKGILLNETHDIEEIGLLLMPQVLKGFSGEIGYLFGHEPLSVINRQFTAKSVTAYMPIRLNAYKEYKKVKKELKSVTITKDLKEGKGFGISLTSMGLVWDWLGIDNLYRVQDAELLIDKLLTKFGNVNLLQNKDKKNKGKTDKEPDYQPKSWRFDSLLDYFTSLIAVVFWKIGLNEFPASVPKNLAELPTLEEIEGERKLDKDARKEDKLDLYFDKGKEIEVDEKLEEKIKEKYYKDVYSLGELQSWHTKQVDALTGMFPIDIEIKDTDLIKVGEQGVKLTFPNMAEVLAEVISSNIEQTSLINALLEVGLRTLQETGSGKSVSTRGYYLMEAIADYLGFKLKKTTKEVQFCYNPTYQSEKNEEEKLDDALKPTLAKIDIEEYDDDTSLEMQLTTLIEAARIIKSALTRKVDPKDKSALKDLLMNAGKFLLEEELKPKGKKEEKEDFDVFLEEVEKGFVDEPGITDKTNPYGRVYDRRPKIREVGKDGKD